jgi:hypothetical protein
MKKIYYLIVFTVLGAIYSNNCLAAVRIDSGAVTSKKQVAATISFSGYTWNVKAPDQPQGPGPNVWSAANVYVDNEGSLHLKLAKNAATGKWECAEVATTEKFGEGTYQWQVEGPLATLDKNIVLGLFNYSGKDVFDEMDMEFAQWGDSSNPHLNYTIWPVDKGTNKAYYTANFTMPGGTYTTQRFIRKAKSVAFKSLYGFVDNDNNVFDSKTFKSPASSISTEPMPVYMNLWLYNGLVPSDGKGMEIVIHSFKFIPL